MNADRHGTLVPPRVVFAYVPAGNTVTALAEWGKPEGKLVSAIYALASEGVPAGLPHVDEPNFDERIKKLLQEDKLVPFSEAPSAISHFYRIHDFRSGELIFKVWHNLVEPHSHLRLVPNAVYRLFPNGQSRPGPNITTFTPDDLAALAEEPGAVLINVCADKRSPSELLDAGVKVILENTGPW